VVWLAPLGPLPGFFIGGTPTAVPDSWGDTSSTHEIRLKVSGTPPRVVIIWVIQVAGELYVVGSKGSGWVAMLNQGGPVEMRMEDKTYRLNARLMTDNWQTVVEAYMDKYRADYPDIVNSFPSFEEAAGSTAVFLLSDGSGS